MAFGYRGGVFHADDIPLPEIAARVGTPTYVYSATALEGNFRAYQTAFAGLNATIQFSLKANGNLALVSHLGRMGAGADIVSVGEMRRALAAGIPPERIVFSGVGKTREELAAAVDAGIMQINVESAGELEALDAVGRAQGRRQKIALRVNPDIDAMTHEKISTGKRGDKFGVGYEEALALYAKAANLAGVTPCGLAVHIGSQLIDLAPYRAAYRKISALAQAIRGVGLTVETIDLGGGLGVTYRDEAPPSVSDYAALAEAELGGLGCRLLLEPGRSIVASAGILLTRVTYRKDGGPRDIVILDAGMNDLARPSLYDAYHALTPVAQPRPDAPLGEIDVVGPICETGDSFARARALPRLESEDLVAIEMAGAYGSSMSSNYNARPLAAEVLVRGEQWSIVRRRQAVEALFSDETIPDWVGES